VPRPRQREINRSHPRQTAGPVARPDEVLELVDG
jgi:hypothetical protein